MVASACCWGECGRYRKCGVLRQSVTSGAAHYAAHRAVSFATAARQREGANQVTRLRRVDQDERGVHSKAERTGDRSEWFADVARAERRNKKVGRRKVANGGVERRGVQRSVGDPLAGELRAERLVSVDLGAVREQCGERWRQACDRRRCWSGDNEDPHGGDDGILVKRADPLSDQLKHEVTQWRSGPGSISSLH